MTRGTAVGGGIWVILLGWRWATEGFHEFLLAQTLFLLAPLVLVPLGLPLTAVPVRSGRVSRLYTLARVLLPIGALALVPAFVLEPPWQVRFALGLPYLLFTACAALHGLARLAGRSAFLVEELALDVALLFLPGGAVWMLAWLGDFSFLGFQGLWVLLTAIHFHFAAFGALLLVGLLGRLLWHHRASAPRAWRLHPVPAVGLMGAFPLLAAGIAGNRVLEVLGVSLYMLLLPGVAGLLFVGASRVRSGGVGRWLLVGSGLAVLGSTTLAVLWGLFRPSLVALPTMLRFHGTLNALGFVGLGVLGLRLLNPASRANVAGVVFSRLSSRGRTGPRFFERLAPPDGRQPTGLVDDFSEYARPDFDPLRVDPEVRRFYEHTASYTLWVVPDWKPGFRLGGRLWGWFARHVQQLVLPSATNLQRHGVKGAIVAVDDGADGRERVRGWIRTYESDGSPIYVAAYSSHVAGAMRYMNIAFPLPFSNMTSILRLDHDAPGGTGLRLTSCAQEEAPGGDQGVYLANPLLPLRLPLNETIWVWSAGGTPATEPPCDDPAVVLRARHEMWFFGRKYLELHYFIQRVGEADPA
ncbi:YndJ family protein [Archangium lipolyticum]|uniref:YndJ family protein n=1 Tax=Archangium lipolyticum TaxID=2970465 RepID=UPI00214A1BD7|nr:YndJ family protein [Archangium lipolyticum]